jgi:hypothetical protein
MPFQGVQPYKMRKILKKKCTENRQRGGALIEMALVLLPFIAITLGGLEYMWHLNVRSNLIAAGYQAARFTAVKHRGPNAPSTGPNSQSLDFLREMATAKAKSYLTDLGYREDFVDSVSVTVNYINDITGFDIPQGNFPQDDKQRYIGAIISIPFHKTMIFGDLPALLFGFTGEDSENYTVIVFMFKMWKNFNES